jgi:cobalt/nickel transport system permease protein
MKVVGAVAGVFAVVLLPRDAWIGYAIAAAVLLLIGVMSRLGPLHLAKRLLYLEPFALGVAVLSLFQANGFHVFLSMLVKSSLCLFCMVLLSSTTPFVQLLDVLRRFRVPALLVTTLALTHRYLFVLSDELERMRRARRSRTFVKARTRVWRSLGTIIAQLFIRASERAERVYDAMCSRGWTT